MARAGCRGGGSADRKGCVQVDGDGPLLLHLDACLPSTSCGRRGPASSHGRMEPLAALNRGHLTAAGWRRRPARRL